MSRANESTSVHYPVKVCDFCAARTRIPPVYDAEHSWRRIFDAYNGVFVFEDREWAVINPIDDEPKDICPACQDETIYTADRKAWCEDVRGTVNRDSGDAIPNQKLYYTVGVIPSRLRWARWGEANGYFALRTNPNTDSVTATHIFTETTDE